MVPQAEKINPDWSSRVDVAMENRSTEIFCLSIEWLVLVGHIASNIS
jgi:hypothetical protein